MINGKVKLLSQDGQVLFSEIEAHLLDLVKTKLLKPYNNILQTEFDNFTNNDLLDATNEIKDLVEEEINKVKDLIVSPDLSNLANKEELKNLYTVLENLQIQIQSIPTQATIELPVDSKVAQKEIIDRFKKLEEELKTVISRSVTGKNVIMKGGGRTLIKVKNEGTTITSALASLDFVGANVTATNIGNDVTVTITGGSGGGGSSAIIDAGFRLTGNELIDGGARV